MHERVGSAAGGGAGADGGQQCRVLLRVFERARAYQEGGAVGGGATEEPRADERGRPGGKWWRREAGELLYHGAEVGGVGGEHGGGWAAGGSQALLGRL